MLWTVFKEFESCMLRKYLNEGYLPTLSYLLPVHYWAA